MASPKAKIFLVLNGSTGVPLTGAAGALSFSAYKDDLGTNLSAPAITEVGGGLYRFTPTFPASPDRAVAYVLDTGGNLPAYLSEFMRPEDWYTDSILDLFDGLLGKWVIFNSGPDANRLVLYRADGVTVWRKFELKDVGGSPTVSAIFQRVPV